MESNFDSIETGEAPVEILKENDNSMEGAENMVAELRKEFPKALRIGTTIGADSRIVKSGAIKVEQGEVDVSVISFIADFEDSQEASEFSRKLEELNLGIRSDIVGIDGINQFKSGSISSIGFKLICPTEVANKLFV